MQQSHSRRTYERMKKSRVQPDMQPQGPTARRRARRRGIALAWTALILIIMLGIVGLSLDFARGALVAHQLHNGADAGSLAGALVVRADWQLAMSRAIYIAHENNADQSPIVVAPNPDNFPDGEVVVGRWVHQLHQFFPTKIMPNAVKVWGDRSGSGGDMPAISLFFGPIFQTPTMDIKRYAIARSIGQRGAGILVLSHDPETDFPGHDETGMVAGGQQQITIDLRGPDGWLGDIQVNSNGNGAGPHGEKDALVVNGAPQTYAANIDVVGTANRTDNQWSNMVPSDLEIPFSVNTGADYMLDPLQGVEPPTFSGMTAPLGTQKIDDAYVVAHGELSADGTTRILKLQPGYYPGGIDLQNGGSEVQLMMGSSVETSVFALGGGADGKSGLCLNGGNLVGNGVTIYVTGAQTVGGTTYNVQYGKVDVTGNGRLQVSPPGDYFLTPTGERQISGLPGISIWQDRGPAGDPPLGPYNTNTATLGGTVDYNLSGTLYFGYNPVKVAGDVSKAGNQLLAGALILQGSIGLGIAYDGRNQEDWTRAQLVE